MAKRKREVEKRIRARAISTIVIGLGLGAFGGIVGMLPTIQNNIFNLFVAIVIGIVVVCLAVLSQYQLAKIEYDEKEEAGKEQSETFESLENAIKELSKIQQEHNELIRELLENRIESDKTSRLMEAPPEQDNEQDEKPQKKVNKKPPKSS